MRRLASFQDGSGLRLYSDNSVNSVKNSAAPSQKFFDCQSGFFIVPIGVELEDFAERIKRNAEDRVGVHAHVEIQAVGNKIVIAVADQREKSRC